MPEVPVEGAFVAILVHQRANIAQIAAQLLRRNRRIIPPFPLRRRSWRKRRCPGPGFPQIPDIARLSRRVEPGIRRIGHLLQTIHQLLSQSSRMLRIVGTKFNQHDAAPLGQQIEFGSALAPQSIYDASLETFKADRLKAQDLRNMVGRDKSILIPNSDQRPMLRAGDQLYLGFEHRHAGAFCPDQRASHIESLRQQLIEVVARDTPGNLRKSCPYQIRILVADRAQRGVDLGAAAALLEGCDRIRSSVVGPTVICVPS